MKLNMSFEFSTLDEARAVIAQFVNVEGDVDRMIHDTIMHADAVQKEHDDAQVQTVPVASNAVTHASLREVLTELKDVEGIGFTYFNAQDVVRHRMVQRIVEAYDAFDSKSVTSLANQDSSPQHDTDR